MTVEAHSFTIGVGSLVYFKFRQVNHASRHHARLPGTHISYIIGLTSYTLIAFLLHTYLVGVPEIMKSGYYNLSPALHSAATKVIGYVSASPSAKFLLAALLSKAFHHFDCFTQSNGEEGV